MFIALCLHMRTGAAGFPYVYSMACARIGNFDEVFGSTKADISGQRKMTENIINFGVCCIIPAVQSPHRRQEAGLL